MRKLIVTAIALAMCAGAVQASEPPVDGEPVPIFASVDELVAIMGGTVTIGMGTMMGTGQGTVQVCYTIHCNNQTVWIEVQATDLWKANVPGGAYRIYLDVDEPADVVPVNGNQVMKTDNLVPWDPAKAPMISTFPAYATETAEFASATAGNFSQDVYITLIYENEDAELPSGDDYSGWVRVRVGLDPSLF